MNFSDVKSITIPEGSVKKITGPNGEILWQQAPSADWHTIWEGSQTIKITGSGTITGATSNFASTANGTGTSPRLRLTFTWNSYTSGAGYNSITYYSGSNSQISTRPTSPLEFNPLASTDNLKVLGMNMLKSYTGSFEARLTKANDTSNNRVRFSLSAEKTGSWSLSSSYYVGFTLTKIEQYY